MKWHDTDLVVASGRDELVIALAGSASFRDLVTNIQTFEPGKIGELSVLRFVSRRLNLVLQRLILGYLKLRTAGFTGVSSIRTQG